MDKEEAGVITEMRRRLLRQAEGDVLELAVGTGRNFRFYPVSAGEDQVRSVTAVDVSDQMLAEAARKLQLYPELGEKLRLERVDAHRLPFPDDSFDTVLQTMGLCSYADPAAVLKEMARVSKPGARILLFEHGVSSNPLLRAWQRARRAQHVQKYGCE